MSQISSPSGSAAGWPVSLSLILAAAAVLRLAWLSTAPPGINQDEAVNAWNAWCLLATGHDQTGAAWPVFSYRALGEHRSALFLYVLLPFEALGGLNVWSMRLPAALAGVLTVAVTAWIGRRMFDSTTGLAAAALTAVNPALIQMSRWGHEACLAPLLSALPVAAMLWSGLVPGNPPAGPVPLRAALAGAISALGCYGYPAIRVFVPPLVAVVLLVQLGSWWRLPRGRSAVACFATGFVALLAPLAYMHLTEPEIIARRAQATWLWLPTDPLAVRVRNVANRYIRHFQPDFLFRTGDADEVVWTAGFGFLPKYLLPTQLLGLAVLLRRLRRQYAARVLAAGIALYPAGDCLNWHISLHGLRSSPGLVFLLLLGGLGVAQAACWLYRRRFYSALLTATAVFGLSAAADMYQFLRSYFLERPRQLAVYHGNHVDLVEAIRWLQPQLTPADTVIFTALGMNQPHVVALVALKYDPHRWFAEPRQFRTEGAWDRYLRFGQFYFLHEWERPALLQELGKSAAPVRIWLILRPGETSAGALAHQILGPDGRPALLIYRLDAAAAGGLYSDPGADTFRPL